MQNNCLKSLNNCGNRFLKFFLLLVNLVFYKLILGCLIHTWDLLALPQDPLHSRCSTSLECLYIMRSFLLFFLAPYTCFPSPSLQSLKIGYNEIYCRFMPLFFVAKTVFCHTHCYPLNNPLKLTAINI